MVSQQCTTRPDLESMAARDLWAHQGRAIAGVRAGLARGKLRICIVIPTGGGKTFTCSTMADTHQQQGGRTLWLTHRQELVDQAYNELSSFGLSVGVIQAGRPANPERLVQVASIQTLVKRGLRPDASLVVVDEAHHGAAETWDELLKHYSRSIVLGPTATPCRGDGQALTFFNHLVVPTSVAELTALGVLVPCTIIRPDHSLGGKKIAQAPVVAWLKHAQGRRTICFSQNTKAAEKDLAGFLDAGIRAEFVHHKSKDRGEIFERYKAGKLDVLINIGIATEGFDDKETSCIILARTVGSEGLFLQMVGRELRACKGKTDSILLDLNGCSHDHGAPEDERTYSLTGEAIRRKGAPVKERFCGVCGVLIEGAAAIVCVECGIERPGMFAPEVTGHRIDKFARHKKRTPEQKKAHYLAMVAEGVRKGHHPAAAGHRYAGMYKEKPEWNWGR